MNAHPFDTELALYAAGDLPGWERFKTGMHVRTCLDCRTRIEAFRLNRKRLADETGDLPPGVNWDRLAAEMTANIRVGLAAGECVSSVTAHSKRSYDWGSFLSNWNWKPVGASAGFVMVFAAAWWLNFSPADSASISRIWDRVVSHGVSVVPVIEHGPVVAASSEGIEFRENGSTMGVSSGTTQPVSVSVSFGGSASARYVDDDTGQVTIATVYVQ